MAIFRAWVGVAALGLWGCTAERGTGGSGLQPLPAAPVAPARSEGSAVFADSALGFEIVRPSEGWQLDASSERTTEGLAIPVVLRHRDSGAQVVLQVAPAVATPTQLAERLNAGLRSQPGFTSSDPEPLAMREGAVGFAFAMGSNVRGRVAVEEGGEGQVFMLLATWPAGAEAVVAPAVEQIFGSVRPIPRT